MFEEVIEAKVSPERIWAAWEKAHATHGEGALASGQKRVSTAEGKSKFKYTVLDVVPGKSFSILWKTLFVRLVFTHAVLKTSRGSEIRYGVQIRGPFGWLVRRVLGKKIRQNISQVLKTIVNQLEHESQREAGHRTVR